MLRSRLAMKKSRSEGTRAAIAQPVDPTRVRAADVMHTDVLVLNADDSIRVAAEQLDEQGASGAPVVDAGGRLIGVLTTRDIARSEHVDDDGVSSRNPDPSTADMTRTADDEDEDEEAFETETFRAHVGGRARIGDWMTPGVTAVDPQATLGEVCRTMVDEAIHRVFVVDAGRLVGVVSTQDVVNLLATPAR